MLAILPAKIYNLLTFEFIFYSFNPNACINNSNIIINNLLFKNIFNVIDVISII